MLTNPETVSPTTSGSGDEGRGRFSSQAAGLLLGKFGLLMRSNLSSSNYLPRFLGREVLSRRNQLKEFKDTVLALCQRLKSN